MVSVRTSILRRPRPLSSHRRADTTTNLLYTLIWDEPDFRRDLETLLHHGLKNLRADTEAERTQLQDARLTIERRQRKLLEAHYNDAIGIGMLRSEQKRLDAELTATTRSLNALSADLTEADKLISIALDIAQHAGASYRQAPDHIRRMFNQLLFEKLDITTDEDGQHHVKATYAAPFGIIFAASTRALVSEARQASRPTIPASTGQTKEPAETGGLSLDVLSDNLIALLEGSSKSIVVELRRFELLTSSMRTKRATNCAIAPPLLRPESVKRYLG
jgi:site-specific DNA recombinase